MLVWKMPMETQTVPEYPLQLGCQTLAVQDPPLTSNMSKWAPKFQPEKTTSSMDNQLVNTVLV